jgi:hypothetical protein
MAGLGGTAALRMEAIEWLVMVAAAFLSDAPG